METYNDEDHADVKDELKANQFKEFVRKRKIERQICMKYVFSGDSFLQAPHRIAGKYLPIIPLYGYHGYVDGVEWYKGLIRGLKDPQRLFNMQISQLAESAASAGQEVPIFDPSQVLGDIADLWADRNDKPYMLANALRNEDGSIAVNRTSCSSGCPAFS